MRMDYLGKGTVGRMYYYKKRFGLRQNGVFNPNFPNGDVATRTLQVRARSYPSLLLLRGKIEEKVL